MFQATLQNPEESDVQVGYFNRAALALIPLCGRGQGRGERTQRMTAYQMVGLIMETYSGILLTWALVPEPAEMEQLVRQTYDELGTTKALE